MDRRALFLAKMKHWTWAFILVAFHLPDLAEANGMKCLGTPRVSGEALDRLDAIKIAQLYQEALIFDG